MIDEVHLESWLREEKTPFEGWDFSHLNGRYLESSPPWSYLDFAAAAMKECLDILDVDTGGGEVFASLSPYPGRAAAVEAYGPNVPRAKKRLEPLGVTVAEASPLTGLPFEDRSFDLVLNRHGSIGAAETYRVLKSGGRFLTQQVGGDNLSDLAAIFGAPQAHPDNVLAIVRQELIELGFEIVRAAQWRGPVTFTDVGALVYYLKAVPWVVPNFDVRSHLDALNQLQGEIDDGRVLEFTGSSFFIDAAKRCDM